MRHRSFASAGIVGAGVLGRLLALELVRRRWRVELFDERAASGEGSASFVAAGMLSPFGERESASANITRLGVAALARWPRLLAEIGGEVFFQRRGTLLVAHPEDREELERFRRKMREVSAREMSAVGEEQLRELEPELLGRFSEGLYFREEGQIDVRAFLRASAEALLRLGVRCHFHTSVRGIEAGHFSVPQGRKDFDWVVDCRGLAAREHFTQLRGVRGELIHVQARGVTLHRPIRVMHPRYPLYVVPRPDSRFIIGATVIESDDAGPVSVRSALELLSAAFSLHPGFAEARILEMVSQCRPAFPSHEPRMCYQPGLLRINGLYRHGYLLSPELAHRAVNLLSNESVGKPDIIGDGAVRIEKEEEVAWF